MKREREQEGVVSDSEMHHCGGSWRLGGSHWGSAEAGNNVRH